MEPSDRINELCTSLYTDTDAQIAIIAGDYTLDFSSRSRELEDLEKHMKKVTPPDHMDCWTTSYENHADYDLFYAEFDDSGNAADINAGRNVTYPNSELHLIKEQLESTLAEAKTQGSGLNIVVFTHGWHGTASAFDDYSIELKGMLLDITAEEQQAHQSRTPRNVTTAPKARRTVGIEVSWRGDSFLNPAIPGISGSGNFANVWDRKSTAGVISGGSVHELFAFLNEFYRENSCDAYGSARGPAAGAGDLQACDGVHMLTIGHSFGALIDMRAIVSRVESGLNVPRGGRAYGFGDLSVLVNPAFEGVGYRGVFDDAVNRKYNDATGTMDAHPYLDATTVPTHCQSQASANSNTPPPLNPGGLPGTDPAKPWEQIPTVVILQSHGDTATGKFFPPEQAIATAFRQTLSHSERIDKNTAVGWIDDFRTHTLAYRTDGTMLDGCVTPTDKSASYCPFIGEHTAKPDYLLLTGVADSHVVPDFMPLWSVMVDAKIMEQHDDFWNPQIVRLISMLFRDTYVQAEIRNRVRTCESQPAP
jgi:hypothetical protein